MRVEVYKNLHSGKWSVRALEGKHKGHVIMHAGSVRLDDCTLKVRQSGREAVLRTGHKNVHATIRGTLVNALHVDWRYWEAKRLPELQAVTRPQGERDRRWPVYTRSRRITYNPYMHSSFVDSDTLASIDYAESVTLYTCGTVRAINPEYYHEY